MADLIKKIKIKKQDGTFTDYIPIGAEAKNISTNDGDSVELKLSKKPYYYNNVADMKADTKLKIGDMAITLGYYEPNDGGGAEYRIIDGDYTDDGGIYHKLNNNLYAELILKDQIYVEQFGAYGDNIHDDYIYLNKAIQYAATKGLTVNLFKKYKSETTIALYQKSGFCINGGNQKKDGTTSLDSFISAPNGFITLDGCRNLTIKGIAIFDFANTSAIAVVNHYSPTIKIEDCYIRGKYVENSIGIYLETAYYSVIRDCFITNCKRAVVIGNATTQSGSGAITIDNCKIGNNGCAYYITTDSDVNIVNCTSETCGTGVYINNQGDGSITIDKCYFGDGMYQMFVIDAAYSVNINNGANRLCPSANTLTSEWGTDLKVLKVQNAKVNLNNLFIDDRSTGVPSIYIGPKTKIFMNNCEMMGYYLLDTQEYFINLPRDINYLTEIQTSGTNPYTSRAFEVTGEVLGTNYMGKDIIKYTNNTQTSQYWTILANYTVPKAGYYIFWLSMLSEDNYDVINFPAGCEIAKNMPITYVEPNTNITYDVSKGRYQVLGSNHAQVNLISPKQNQIVPIPVYINDNNLTGVISIAARQDKIKEYKTIKYIGLTNFDNPYKIPNFD